jgi:hypothetical protein
VKWDDLRNGFSNGSIDTNPEIPIGIKNDPKPHVLTPMKSIQIFANWSSTSESNWKKTLMPKQSPRPSNGNSENLVLPHLLTAQSIGF